MFFKYIRSRKPAKHPVGPLDDRDTKGALKDNKVIAEKLNEFFASVFMAEVVREIPKPEPSFEYFEGVNKHVVKGDPVDIVYLDFQKAFDKVPHQRLLRKLSCHGIRGKILSWIENWLKGREQRVGINGKFSEWRGVTSGVPQGSVLGPILFNLFINDLEKGVNSDVTKFADDTKLLKIVKTTADCEELQKDLTKLSDWATKWQIKFNVENVK
ncbi:unnamed protein product [Caretta caretta]